MHSNTLIKVKPNRVIFTAFALILALCPGLNIVHAQPTPDSNITYPTRQLDVTFPVMITGTVSSDVPVQRLDLIIKNEAGEFWNGTTFQTEWSKVIATITANNWQYDFTANQTGKFFLISRAWNTNNTKQTSASYVPFYARYHPPVAAITFPASKQIVRSPLLLTGNTSNANATRDIQLVIRNKDKQYWNGTTFQSAWHGESASLNNDQWTYSLETSTPQDILVRVKTIDNNEQRQAQSANLSFTLLPPDTTHPAAAISSPSNGAVTQNPLTISGTVFDDDRIDRIELVIRDTQSGNYWNGSTFQSSWISVNAETSQTQWSYTIDTNTSHKIAIKAKAIDDSGNRQIIPARVIVELLSCSHYVKGTATPANSGTPTTIDTESISYTSGTIISANFFNSGAIIDREGRTVSICVSDATNDFDDRRAQITTDVGQTDNTAIKAYPSFIIGSKFGLVDETSFRPYPIQTSSTGFKYPDLEAIAGLVGLPARTDNLPDIDIVLNIEEQNVRGAERDVMLESWFYDLSANAGQLGSDAAGNSLNNTLNNIVGDGHPNPLMKNLLLEMMVHVGALSPNDVSQATRNPSKYKLTETPIAIGDHSYHIWHGDTHLAPLVVFSRETDINGDLTMDLTNEGNIKLDWNLFLDFTLNSLEQLLANNHVSWAIGDNNIFPTLRTNGAVGGLEVGIEPQTNNPLDQPYIATFNKLDVKINGQQFGFK